MIAPAVPVPGLNKLIPVEDAPGDELYWGPAKDSLWKEGEDLLFLTSFPAKQNFKFEVSTSNQSLKVFEVQNNARELREIVVRINKI